MPRTYPESFSRGGRTALALGVAIWIAAAGAAEAAAQTSMDKARARREASSPFRLQAGATVVLQANLVQCGLANTGDVCTDIFNSPTGGGGFWPSGTTNQYIFNSGLQIAGIIPTDAGFGWAGDTVGAYFFDARGTQPHGTPRTDIFDSLNPADLANWPADAYVTDADLFAAPLLGARAISDQDSWVRYWDGDPNRISARDHPMGIQVEQRSLAFNAPVGAEHTIFFLYRFRNVTNDPEFVELNRGRFPDANIPAGGYPIDSIYAAFSMDPDVTTHATDNFSTAILPFNLGVAYHAPFVTDDFNFSARAELYAPPFFQGPGFVGVKYLQSPINPATGQEIGLTLFSNTLNQATGFPDPVGVKQLWRYLSGRINTALGDNPCNVPDEKLCFLAQDPADTRFYQASGPFRLGPGEEATIVVAYTHGAPVRIPGYTIGTRVRPGIPSETPGVHAGDTLRWIERMAGWISTPAAAIRADGSVDETQVRVVPRSLLSNALVAQTIFNNKFLLPRPPEPPLFTLVPANRQVTVIWQPSATHERNGVTCEEDPTMGDPYYVIASDPDPTNPLYDPNYRRCDVEGYRIYRATGLSGGFELIAEFDRTGTVFIDRTGQLDPEFVPEEGAPYPGPVDHELVGTIVQYPAGARIRDAVTGAVIVLDSEEVTLRDTGIPFVYVDRDVRNGITYRYIVTAFDVNSLASGPMVLESPRQPQQVVPRGSGQQVTTEANYSVALRGETQALDPSAPLPTIDAQGRFSGSMPPTSGLDIGELILALPQAIVPGQLTLARIDSVIPLTYSVRFHITLAGGDEITVEPPDGEMNTIRGGLNTELIFESIFTIPADTTVIRGQFAVMPEVAGAVPATLTVGRPQWASGVTDWTSTTPQFFTTGQQVPAGSNAGGSRWFEGANETMADPTLNDTWGQLSGITTIYSPQPFVNANAVFRRFHQAVWAVMRSADVEVTWSGGQVQSVFDVTHDVTVQFKARPQAAYGFLPDADGDGVISYLDTKRLDFQDAFGGWRDGAARVGLVAQPVVGPVDVTGNGAADGTGFALYINGELYFFLGSPPASGTWTLRSYHGSVRKTADGYSFTPSFRMPAIPGLQLAFTVTSPAVLATSTDLSRVHTVPDPYYVRSAFDVGPSNKILRFVNLPNQAVVRIFSVNGTLVRVLEHNDATGGGELSWDLRNRNNQFVASGVYFYVVEASGGGKKVGRFTVIQFAR
jgi:hypothetical protein